MPSVGSRSTVDKSHAKEWIAELRIIASAKWAGPGMIGDEDESHFPRLSFVVYFIFLHFNAHSETKQI